MLVAQLLPFAKNLATRKWSDEDIVEDVVFLRDELNARFNSLTQAFALSLHGYFLRPLMTERMTSMHRSWRRVTCLGRLCTILRNSGRRTQPS